MKHRVMCMMILLFYMSAMVPTMAGGKIVPDLELTEELANESDVAYIIPMAGEYQVVVYWLNEPVYISPDKDDAVIVVSKLNDYWMSLDLKGRIQWLREIATF